MNLISELLTRCKHEDGIKPEYDRQQMAAELVVMHDDVFDKLVIELKNAALIKDLMNNKRIELTTSIKG